jgi:hypothetical protein
MNKENCTSKGGKWDNGQCFMPTRKISSKSISKRPSFALLLLSLLIDAIGMISYLFPGIGEMIDIAWAPLSAIILYLMYGSIFASLIQALEEVAPGTDIIPTATITWIFMYVKGGK